MHFMLLHLLRDVKLKTFSSHFSDVCGTHVYLIRRCLKIQGGCMHLVVSIILLRESLPSVVHLK
ncbi:hypothetical protein RchiOBHm_Chr2g0136941 [Rosa chinensis]|uniref:Uncharacterized protein n=1 Tax=Rosa chinensis TaxID=74649 RepID=A0A2P6RWG0_ROSCH|nr:hypothetical protein RchiOBHm_Chr2g0136941 [Rosa chinensis]